MMKMGRIGTFVFLIFVVAVCEARTINNNPDSIITTIGPDTYFVGLGEVLPQDFQVRLTDAQGAPRSGVTVEFFPNVLLQFEPPPIGASPLPPRELYGTLGSSGHAPVRTDANGVATAPPFTTGTYPGTYDVAAYVSPFGDGNAAVGFPGPIAFFRINQNATGAASVPALSWLGRGLLAVMLVAVAARRVRFARVTHSGGGVVLRHPNGTSPCILAPRSNWTPAPVRVARAAPRRGA